MFHLQKTDGKGVKMRECEYKTIILDDDPTGVQTVHDMPVYTDWEMDTLRDAFLSEAPVFFILTNSRALTEDQTKELHVRLAERIYTVSKETEKSAFVILRGDSTLRGHYISEVKYVCSNLYRDRPVEAVVICPCFFECGRITRDNVQYIVKNGEEIPVYKTEFARDRTFGYESRTIPDFIRERSKANIPDEQFVIIHHEELREEKEESIYKKISETTGGKYVIVNAVTYEELDVFTRVLRRVVKAGKRLIARSAASFVHSFCEVEERAYLTYSEMGAGSGAGGLVVVGSHVDLSSRQLDFLRRHFLDACYVEFDVGRVLENRAREDQIRNISHILENAISSGQTAVLYTSRHVLAPSGADREGELEFSKTVSDELVAAISGLHVRPSYIIAKGGITSSEIGTRALQVKKAEVMGQIKAGISVWKLGEESRYPGMPYVIFPGNVGKEEDLYDIVQGIDQVIK